MTMFAGAVAPAPTAAVSTSRPRTAGRSRECLRSRPDRAGASAGAVEEDEEPRRARGDQPGAAHDQARARGQKPRSGRCGGRATASAAADASIGPEQREHDREEGHSREHRDRGDDQPADAEAAHERQRHEEQQGNKADRDGRAAEHDRPARGRHRPHDRILLRVVPAQLLAEAVDDQQRVVDRDPEPDQRDEVLEVGRQLHEVREDPDQPERGGIVTSANRNGSRKASVPKVKTRISSAIGTAISSPLARSRPNTGSRSCSIAACPVM